MKKLEVRGDFILLNEDAKKLQEILERSSTEDGNSMYWSDV